MRHTTRPARRAIVLGAALSLAPLTLGACGRDGSDAATPSTAPPDGTTPSAVASTTTAATTTAMPTTTSSPPAGCTSGDGTPPAGSAQAPIPDVDGDGRTDVGWVSPPDASSGTTTIGIQTAAGGGATMPFESASPVEPSILVVDVDANSPVEILLSDGRGARLAAFVDCAIQPVRNPEGEPYAFDLHDLRGTGSGIGCRGEGADRRLVGLDHEPAAADGSVAWTSTDIDLDGLRAENGTTRSGTFHPPADAAAIELLSQISCGDLTMVDDGIHGPA